MRGGTGEQAADLIAHLKKGEMAKEAERLLADTGWLPEPLRPVLDATAVDGATGEDDGDVTLCSTSPPARQWTGSIPTAGSPVSLRRAKAMPEVLEITVFRFDELSDAAKKRARAWYRDGGFDYD